MMMGRIRKVAIATAIAVVALSYGCQSQVQDGAATTPANTGNNTLALEQEWVLGDDANSTELVFGNVLSLSADDLGYVYVVDGKERKIYKLAPDGTFDRQIGSSGDGPGEFQYAFEVVVAGDSISVLQTRGRLLVFERTDAAFRRQHTFAEHPQLTPVDLLGARGTSFVAIANDVGPLTSEGNASRLVVTELGGTTTRILMPLRTIELMVAADGRGWTVAPYPRKSYCAATMERVYCGFSDAIRFDVFSFAGDSLGVFEADFSPMPIDAADRAAVRDKYAGTTYEAVVQFNATWPAYDAVVGDDRGRLWIKVRVTRDDATTTLWAIDTETDEVQVVIVGDNITPLFVRDGALYARLARRDGTEAVAKYRIVEHGVARSEQGEQFVVRYRFAGT